MKFKNNHNTGLTMEHVSYFIPDTKISIEESLDRFRLTQAQAKVYTKIYGLKYIPIAAHMTIYDLIIAPIEKIINETGVDKKQIKFLIHAHTAKVIAPFGDSVINTVKNKLELTEALAFSTTLNNCASTFNALETAAILLKNCDDSARAIVVTGELAFTPTVQVIPNTSITGDAAAAALISLSGSKNKLLSLEMITRGEYAAGIWLSPAENQEFEKNYASFLSKAINNVLKKNSLSLDNIKVLLPHNVNTISWSAVSKQTPFPLEKIYLKNIHRTAHCFGADIFINFVDAFNEGMFCVGDYYLMATVGLGATFAAAVFQH